jgi:CheY-like chemotaxis protein
VYGAGYSWAAALLQSDASAGSESGQEALAAAALAEPDVAVIDVLMPTMSGIECAHLPQERYPKARVILISGSIFDDKRRHPDERGTDAYLEKSEVPERLYATILAPAADTTAAPPSQTNA